MLVSYKMNEKDENLNLASENKSLLSNTHISIGQEKLYYYAGFIYLPFIISIIVILSLSEDDCDNPIRFWLSLLSLSYAITFSVAICEAVFNVGTHLGKWIGIPIGLLNIFQFAWIIIGCVWLFGDDKCSDKWYDGYALTLAIIIIFFIGCGIFVMMFFCLCCCAGILAGSVPSSEDEVKNN